MSSVVERYRKWIAEGAVVTQDAADRLCEVIQADVGGRSDGSGRFRPSMLDDACLRKQMLSYNGVDHLPLNSSIATTGTFSHYRWQAAGLSEGFLVNIEVPVQTHWGLKGSADGLTDTGLGFELKTTTARNVRKILGTQRPPDYYRLQLESILDATKWPAMIMVFESRETYGPHHDYAEIVYHSDPEWHYRLMTMREALVNHAAYDLLPGILPDCKRHVGDQYNDCLWRKTCFEPR